MTDQSVPQPTWTIGYGNETESAIFKILAHNQIQFLIDVRTSPYSRYRPEFNRETLDARLASEGVKYLFLGDELGGRPDDPSVYEQGKVVYNLVREKDYFRKGLERILDAGRKNLKVCLFCSEGDPAKCHRSKLIGAALAEAGHEVLHIDPDGTCNNQEEVIQRVTGGQLDLFGDNFTSNRSYLKDDQKPESGPSDEA